MKKLLLLISALTTLGGCVSTSAIPDGSAQDAPDPMLEAVAALAAPGQDLSSVRLLPEDGCYWYEHDGPVERTLLPLRTSAGRPICLAPAT